MSEKQDKPDSKEQKDRDHPYWRMGFTTFRCPECSKDFHCPEQALPAAVLCLRAVEAEIDDGAEAGIDPSLFHQFFCSDACAETYFAKMEQRWPGEFVMTPWSSRPRPP